MLSVEVMDASVLLGQLPNSSLGMTGVTKRAAGWSTSCHHRRCCDNQNALGHTEETRISSMRRIQDGVTSGLIPKWTKFTGLSSPSGSSQALVRKGRTLRWR